MSDITVETVDFMGDDLSVVNAARISYAANSGRNADGSLSETDTRLIRFLARGMSQADYASVLSDLRDAFTDIDIVLAADILNKYHTTPLHRSPFNHAFASFKVRAPVFVARQLVKHEYLPWNEVSGRYVTFTPDFFTPVLRVKAPDKKQGSGLPLQGEARSVADQVMEESGRTAFETYQALLSLGVCEEQARMVLPLNLMTEWVWSGSLGAFAKMAVARLRADTQAETRHVASLIDAEMGLMFPVSWQALVHPETI